MAQTFRPKIPLFPNFPAHISRKIDDYKTKYPPILDLYRLIMSEQHVDTILIFYSSFRHWGHPYLDYLLGLEKLHAQVTCPKEIDEDYANLLASDLAFMVLKNQFEKKKKWFVTAGQLNLSHVLYPFISQNIWPTPDIIEQFGPRWHLLPLEPCFEIPDMIDPSIVYSDRSHSMSYPEVKNWIKARPGQPIPSKKVLNTLLERPATNWKEFLKQVNDSGIPWEYLIIGLKGKEREIKLIGRFFSLMSWMLRDYIVITEYLIKLFYVPLMYGITMADDLNTVLKKILENSSGQGLDDYSYISIANHIDYEKWNNHQRLESNGPVFKVMGQFIGYPMLFYRTHEFFQKSFIYYGPRADLMKIVDDKIVNKGTQRVCWDGQAGGLEGLRQKGWSVLNALVVLRESSARNTMVKSLMQGDNQVICTQYKLQKCRTDEELKLQILKIVSNNNKILESIIQGTNKLGLIINNDETMQSADFLNYGKVPIFRGNVRGLETKRWSRVTCVTNDQLPTLANTLSTVSSNALTVSHSSSSILNPIVHYNFLGNFVRLILEYHNPAIRNKLRKVIKNPHFLKTVEYKISTLYLDPSMGGVCGCSLTRFLMRGFPDPITESLSFFKLVHNGTEDPQIKNLMIKLGNPRLGRSGSKEFSKLLEDPLAINIPKGINSITMLKEAIKTSLYTTVDKIRNHVIADAVRYNQRNEGFLFHHLRSIQPCFPRFLSQYKESTYLGVTESLVGLFQNSRTIRNFFSSRLKKELDSIIVNSELIGYKSLTNTATRYTVNPMWACSASQADKLRQKSWGRRVYGATIPHPSEMIVKWSKGSGSCDLCFLKSPKNLYLSCILPNGMVNYWNTKGPYSAYLGSKTSETTSITQPWERETKIPVIKRAANLRTSIGWFVEPSSNLAQSIHNNLTALTGEDWSRGVSGYKRTGSALHRFSSTRQSAGGYIAQSPVKSTRIIATTNTLEINNTVNYDFMFQSLLLYVEITSGEIQDGIPDPEHFHFHIACPSCLREIEEVVLECPTVMLHPDVSSVLNTWKPANVSWSTSRPSHTVEPAKWNHMDMSERSFHIGRAEGFLYAEMFLNKSSHVNDSSLFPLTIQNKVIPQCYIDGLIDGLARAGALSIVYRRSIAEHLKPFQSLIGMGIYLIGNLSQNPNLINIFRCHQFEALFASIPHKVPSSFPTNNADMSSLCRNYMRERFLTYCRSNQLGSSYSQSIIVFSDTNQTLLVGLLSISDDLLKLLNAKNLPRGAKNDMRRYRENITNFRSNNEEDISQLLGDKLNKIKYVDHEVRHACKHDRYTFDPDDLSILQTSIGSWGKEYQCESTVIPVIGVSTLYPYHQVKSDPRKCPLISGLRLFQCATGSHYKITGILKNLNLVVLDALCGGDGSGGIGSKILRTYHQTRLIFNSLLEYTDVTLKGTSPTPPSAIYHVPHIRNRCVNLNTVWKEPTDLSHNYTWKHFLRLRDQFGLKINLVILDMETRSIETSQQIEKLMRHYIPKLCSKDVTVIYKTYLNIVLNHGTSCLNYFINNYESVFITYTDLTSSHSSEVYIVGQTLRTSKSVQIFPDYAIIQQDLASHPGFTSDFNEFKRAGKIIPRELLQGVPKNMLVDPFLELGQLLCSLGVYSGIAYRLSENLRAIQKLKLSDGLALLLICLNHLFSITKPLTGPVVPPSDNCVRSMGIIVVGFFQWASWSLQSFTMYQATMLILDNYFPFSCGMVKDDKGFNVHTWSISKSLLKTKAVHLDDKMASIGQTIRCFTRMFGKLENNFNTAQIDPILKNYDKGLTYELFHSRTSLIFDILNLNVNTLVEMQNVALLPLSEVQNYGNPGLD